MKISMNIGSESRSKTISYILDDPDGEWYKLAAEHAYAKPVCPVFVSYHQLVPRSVNLVQEDRQNHRYQEQQHMRQRAPG